MTVPAFSTDRSAGRWKVQVGATGENTWAENALTFETKTDAEAYSSDLLGRWMGADIARVVPVEEPTGTPIDQDDPRIVINYRRQHV